MWSNHHSRTEGSYDEHRQDRQERRSPPKPYEWYDECQSRDHYRLHNDGKEDHTHGKHQMKQRAQAEQSSKRNETSIANADYQGRVQHASKITKSSSTLPHRSTSSSSKSLQTRWYLTKEFQDFVRSSRTDTLLLLDDHCRMLSASREMYVLLQSVLPLDERNSIKGVITVSKDGRWLALVACRDENIAKKLATNIKNETKDLEAKFVTNEVFDPFSQSRGQRLILAEGLRQQFSQEGVLVDEWFSPGNFDQIQPISTEKRNVQNFLLPDNVSKDHRKITSSIPIAFAKRSASQISRWNAQQEVMQQKDLITSEDSFSNVEEQMRNASDGGRIENEFDYLDEGKKACILCQRQFKTLEVLKRHSIESELHKKNLRDEDCCSEGRKRKKLSDSISISTGMKKAGFAPVQKDSTDEGDSSTTAESNIEYRDRAAERRIVFGTEAIAKAKAMTKKRPHPSGSSNTIVSASDDTIATKLDESSIGGSLLAKMGWTAGKGLGTNGEGRTDPIITYVHTPGAGIGSRGGSKPAPTVEEYSSRQTKFIQGDKTYQRSAKMQERYYE